MALHTADVARGEVKFFHTFEDPQASFIFSDRTNKEDGVAEVLGVRRKIEGRPPRCSVSLITSQRTSPMLIIFTNVSLRSGQGRDLLIAGEFRRMVGVPSSRTGKHLVIPLMTSTSQLRQQHAHLALTGPPTPFSRPSPPERVFG